MPVAVHSPSFLQALRALWRLLRMVLHMFWGAWIIRWIFPRLEPHARDVKVQEWAHALLRHMGVRVKLSGTPPASGPVLLVSNHISWLDIVVLHAARHCRFISKSDIKQWPLVGFLATAAGTLYIERESRRDAMRVVHHMAEALRDGDVLAVFPEGTTGDGLSVLPFHANLLQAAITTDAPVQPIGLHFVDRRTGQTSLAPCYVGDDTLVQSVWRTLCTQDLEAVVQFGVPQQANGRDRRAWSVDLHAAVTDLRGCALRTS